MLDSVHAEIACGEMVITLGMFGKNGLKDGVQVGSDVLGWASSPEPTKLSPFKPKPGWALTRACSGLRLGFRYQKPKPEAQAQAFIHCVLVCRPTIGKVKYYVLQ